MKFLLFIPLIYFTFLIEEIYAGGDTFWQSSFSTRPPPSRVTRGPPVTTRTTTTFARKITTTPIQPSILQQAWASRNLSGTTTKEPRKIVLATRKTTEEY